MKITIEADLPDWALKAVAVKIASTLEVYGSSPDSDHWYSKVSIGRPGKPETNFGEKLGGFFITHLDITYTEES